MIPRPAAKPAFCAIAIAGASASAKPVSVPGKDEPSMCWLCVGTPAIKPTNTSALRAGIALIDAGIVEVAGQVFAGLASRIVPPMCSKTFTTF